MSLTQLVDTLEGRELYAKHAQRILYPSEIRKMDIQVPSFAKPVSLMGTAYDYFLRFRLARNMHVEGVNVCDDGWIAERSLSLMVGEFAPFKDKWTKIINTAWERYLNYVETGEMDLEKIAICVQYLANADNLYRIDNFNPHFRHNEYITNEILKMEKVTDYSLFGSPKMINLNPNFVLGEKIGGADADLILDNRLIDIKTTSKIAAPLSYLRQLSGYAALQSLEGSYEGPDGINKEPFERIGIFYPRFGLLADWSLDEIFNGRFEDYVKDFSALVEEYGSKLKNELKM